MNDITKQLALAEKYLDEMLAAEKADDYEAWMQRFEKDNHNGPSKDNFHKDIEHMRQTLGAYQSREYFGSIKMSNEDKYPDGLRFFWKGVFEKKELLIAIGIHQKSGVWYVNHNVYSA
ncbi:hypothetical protein [Marinomonas transparens]|uniref:Uncharacterized protein n=1 Tax=Marinomonas transparens TaxID=2795388 RepID=A0A934JSA1_9GAMM|nr:hypothetical protein [Marinomonas transparens]MBJ7539084.1 hypothetical protein [Marinomonas transparens]